MVYASADTNKTKTFQLWPFLIGKAVANVSNTQVTAYSIVISLGFGNMVTLSFQNIKDAKS